MAAGIRALRKIQIGYEAATPGTPVAATARLVGTLGMKMDQKYYRPSDLETGRLSEFERSIVVGQQAKLPFAADANYQQLGYILEMGVKGAIAGVGPTDGQYIHTFLPNLAAANAPSAYTLEYGDDVQAYRSPFCYATGFEISGSLDDAVKVKANLVGQYVAQNAFTGAIASPTLLTPVITGTGKFYIDALWATMVGATPTQVTVTLIDFSYKVPDAILPVKYADGTIYFSAQAEKKRHVELNLTLAYNAIVAHASTGLWVNYIASPQTPKFIGIKFTGPLVGTTHYNELNLFGCFIIDDFDTLTEREGQDIVKLKLVSQYDPTAPADTNEWEIVLKNAVSTFLA